MTLAKQIREKVLQLKEGMVVTLADFELPMEQQPALNVTLNRLVAEGVLRRLSKGRYYREKHTIFGSLPPNETEVVKDYLVKNGQTVGYITGPQAFAEMGLTTQISSKILIGTNKYRRPVKRGNYEIAFLLQPNPIIENEINLYRILDALRLVRDIPGTTPDEAVYFLMGVIARRNEDERKRMVELAGAYTPYVRSLLGAILEQSNLPTYDLRQKLNGVTRYQLPISEAVLPGKNKWNIV